VAKPQIAEQYPALFLRFRDAGLKLVDIGGRGAPMPSLDPLAAVGHYYTCEPDAEEAARLSASFTGECRWRGVTVIPDAIASHRGEAQLHITAQPGMSSLLRPDEAVARKFALASKFAVARSVAVNTIPLDDAARQYGFADAAFLKLDTQGTELDILRSGSRLLDESIVGVHLESLFRPFYVGQSLFGDVDAHLRARGFELFALSRTGLRRSGFRPDLFSKRVPTWGHCLYLREPETITATSTGTAIVRLVRLLAIALAFEQFDLAFEVIQHITLHGAAASDALASDVQRWAARMTRLMMRRAAEFDAAETVLASKLRDRGRVE
jgi:FkbM family methyltransferase